MFGAGRKQLERESENPSMRSNAKRMGLRCWSASLSTLLCLFGASVVHAATWTSLGPGGGLVRALAIDPTNSATVYAGTVGGGVFKSTDGGGS